MIENKISIGNFLIIFSPFIVASIAGLILPSVPRRPWSCHPVHRLLQHLDNLLYKRFGRNHAQSLTELLNGALHGSLLGGFLWMFGLPQLTYLKLAVAFSIFWTLASLYCRRTKRCKRSKFLLIFYMSRPVRAVCNWQRQLTARIHT